MAGPERRGGRDLGRELGLGLGLGQGVRDEGLGVRNEGSPKPNPDPNPNQVGGIWPGFRGNVTIKPCTTVVLDLNLDVQLYSLIIMQQA